jgi:hypothetical protein
MVIGTNIIRRCKYSCIEKHGNGYLQRVSPDLAWRLAYQHLTQQEKTFSKTLNTKKVRIESNSPSVIHANETVVVWTTFKTRKIGASFPALQGYRRHYR